MSIFDSPFQAGLSLWKRNRENDYIGSDYSGESEQVPFGNLRKIKDSTVSTNLDYSTTNIYPQSESGQIVIQTKKEQTAEAMSSEEKPVNLSPSLLGSGGSTSTGESELTTSGGNILTYVLIGAGVLVGGYFLTKK